MRDELHKHTIFLRKGDYDALASYGGRVKPAAIIRKIVSDFVDKLDAQSQLPTDFDEDLL